MVSNKKYIFERVELNINESFRIIYYFARRETILRQLEEITNIKP